MTSHVAHHFRSLPAQSAADHSKVLVPVDPFKASVAYGVKAKWSSSSSRPDDLETPPPPRRQGWFPPPTFRPPLDSGAYHRDFPQPEYRRQWQPATTPAYAYPTFQSLDSTGYPRNRVPRSPSRIRRSTSRGSVPQRTTTSWVPVDQELNQQLHSSNRHRSPSRAEQASPTISMSAESQLSSVLSAVSVDSLIEIPMTGIPMAGVPTAAIPMTGIPRTAPVIVQQDSPASSRSRSRSGRSSRPRHHTPPPVSAQPAQQPIIITDSRRSRSRSRSPRRVIVQPMAPTGTTILPSRPIGDIPPQGVAMMPSRSHSSGSRSHRSRSRSRDRIPIIIQPQYPQTTYPPPTQAPIVPPMGLGTGMVPGMGVIMPARSRSRSRSPHRHRAPVVVIQPQQPSWYTPRHRSYSPERRSRHYSPHRERSPSRAYPHYHKRSSSRGRSRTPPRSHTRSRSYRRRSTTSRPRRSRSRSANTSLGPKVTSNAEPSTRPAYPIYSPITPVITLAQHRPSDVDSEHNGDPTLKAYVLAFLMDTCPRQIYLHFLLRLPYFYFSRVSRIFEEAELTMPQIKRGIMEAAAQRQVFPMMGVVEPPSAQYGNLEQTWQSFIDSLLREWKTFNIISVLLLSAILTILQIDSAANDPLTRFSALTSMICALMSLLYGCIYIIRFGTMRKTYKAAEWAQESQRSRTGIFWNVWTLLAMPAIWLAWSMILYIVCIMSFVWRSGTVDDRDGPVLTGAQALAPRIVVSTVLCLGLVYLTLITSTLRRYGEMMDRAWQRRITGWMSDETGTYPVPHLFRPIPPVSSAYKPFTTVEKPYQDFPNSWSRRSLLRKTSSVFPGPPPAMNFLHLDTKTVDQKEIQRSSNRVSSHRGRSPEVKTSMARSLSFNVSSPALKEKSSWHSNPPSSRIKGTKLLGLPPDTGPNQELNSSILEAHSMSIEQWEAFTKDIVSVWNVKNKSAVEARLKHWNQIFFNDRGGQVILGLDPRDQFAVLHLSTLQPLSSPMGYNGFGPQVELGYNIEQEGGVSLPNRQSPVDERTTKTTRFLPSGHKFTRES